MPPVSCFCNSSKSRINNAGRRYVQTQTAICLISPDSYEFTARGFVMIFAGSKHQIAREMVPCCLERVSTTPPESNPEAADIKEGPIAFKVMIMTHQQSPGLSQPGIGAFHDPAPFVAPEFPPIVVGSCPFVAPIGRNQVQCVLPSGGSCRVGLGHGH